MGWEYEKKMEKEFQGIERADAYPVSGADDVPAGIFRTVFCGWQPVRHTAYGFSHRLFQCGEDRQLGRRGNDFVYRNLFPDQCSGHGGLFFWNPAASRKNQKRRAGSLSDQTGEPFAPAHL